MNTSQASPCKQCGSEMPVNAPGGLCPRCLMAMNMAEPTCLLDEDSLSAAAAPPPAPEEIAPLFPSLEILECLGRGGMGVVYKARQKSLNRLVALKILAPERVKDPAFAKRFVVEAEALARLNHANIVTIHDFGQADGLFYFVMEYVDGLNLRQLLHSGRIAPREALAIVPQICDALQYAHDAGIVHRDIKPENILLDRLGRVKVADFGLAKLVGQAEPGPAGTATAAAPMTEGGKVIGTPQYMAPEQTDHPSEVDHRADIYSLGVVFYQMLTGEMPGKKLEPPSKKVVIDVRLDEVVLRALEANPKRRYQQVSQVKTMVETIVAEGGEEKAGARVQGSGVSPAPGGSGSTPTAASPASPPPRQPAIPAGSRTSSVTNWGVVLIIIGATMMGMANLGGLTPLVWVGTALMIVGGWQRWRAKVRAGREEARGQESEVRSQKSEVSEQPPRFSRTAIVGVCWAAAFGLFFSRTAIWGVSWAAAFCLTYLARSSARFDAHQLAWWQYVMPVSLMLAGFSAPFGTTILGWIAIAQIRRSEGRLYGLGLALFDALLFPLLALLFAIVGVCRFLAKLIVYFDANPPVLNNPNVHPAFMTRLANTLAQHPALPSIAGGAIAVVLGIVIVRAVWRAVKSGSTPTEAGVEAGPPTDQGSRPRRKWYTVVGDYRGTRIIDWFRILLAGYVSWVVVSALLMIAIGLTMKGLNMPFGQPKISLSLLTSVATVVIGLTAFVRRQLRVPVERLPPFKELPWYMAMQKLMQPPLVRDIHEHMTAAEKRSFLTLSMSVMLLMFALCVPFGLLLRAPNPTLPQWLGAALSFAGVFALAALWTRLRRQFLCSTEWARQQGITPEKIKADGRAFSGKDATPAAKAGRRWIQRLVLIALAAALVPLSYMVYRMASDRSRISDAEIAGRATAFVEDLRNGRIAEAHARIDWTLGFRWTDEELRQWWQTLVGHDGPVQSIRVLQVERGPLNMRRATVMCAGEKRTYGLRLSFFPTGEIEDVHTLLLLEDKTPAPTEAGGPWIAALPGGTTVELVALASNSDTKAPAWRPDGTFASEPFHRRSAQSWVDGKVMRVAAFRIRGGSAEGVSVKVRCEDKSGIAPQGGGTRQAGQAHPYAEHLEQIACPPDLRTANIQVAVATEPWQTVSVVSDPTGNNNGWGDRDGNAGTCSCVSEKNGQAMVTLTRTQYRTDVDLRVRAIGSDGKEHQASEVANTLSGDLGHQTYTFRELSAKDIQRLQIQRRSFQWVEFRNVALQPDPTGMTAGGTAVERNAGAAPPAVGSSVERRPAIMGRILRPVAVLSVFALALLAVLRAGRRKETETPAEAKAQRRGRLALALCIGGVALPAALLASGLMLQTPRQMIVWGAAILLAGLCELAAIVLGIVGWKSGTGKAAVITAALLPVLFLPGVAIAGCATALYAAAHEPRQARVEAAKSEQHRARVKMVLLAETGRQLQGANIHCDHIEVTMVTDSEATVVLANPKELRRVDESNVWTNIEGVLIAQPKGGGFWEVRGNGDPALERLRFTVQVPTIERTPAAAPVEPWAPALAPGEKPDLQKIRNEADNLMRQGRYEEALQRHIWYFSHALAYGESDPVRLSFGLAGWGELARRYPKAKQALIDVRDRDAQAFAKGGGYVDLFSEVANINRELRDDDATIALFQSVRQQDPALASQCYFHVEALLAGAGRKPEAETIRDQAVALLDDPRLKSAVSAAEDKVRHKPTASHAATQPLSFGPVTNGLQAAVELTTSNGVFRLGEPIALHFHIRNASDHPITVAGRAYRQGDQCIIEDEQGRRVDVSMSRRLIRTLTQRLLLAPGEVMVFESGGLTFYSESDDKSSYLASYSAKAEPGRYTLRFRLRLPNAGPADNGGPDDWQGELETAPVVVDVKAAAESAPPRVTTVPTPAAATAELAAPPQLRFLAWQDENPSFFDWKAWRPDGERADSEQELWDLNHVQPTRIDISATAEGRGTRILFLWFSHPDIRASSIAELTLTDPAGQALPPCRDGGGGSTHPANASERQSGWFVRWYAPPRDTCLPATVNVTLKYSLGDWQFPEGGEVTREQFSGTKYTMWGLIPGAGETADGKAFVTLMQDPAQRRDEQVDFAAMTTDGKVLHPCESSTSGPEAMRHTRFAFDAPLPKIKEFRLRTRPIRTAEYRDVAVRGGANADTATEATPSNAPPRSLSPRLQFSRVAEDIDTAPTDELADPGDPSGAKKLRVFREVLLDETAVASATVTNRTTGTTEILLTFTPEAAKWFAIVTEESIGKRLAIVFDGKLLSAPTILEKIGGGRASIAGTFSDAEAAAIAVALNAGKPVAEDAGNGVETSHGPRPEIATIAISDVLTSLKDELVLLSTHFPELAEAGDIKIENDGRRVNYLHNCKYWGKRGYEDTGSNACAIGIEVMPFETFQAQLGEKQLPFPSRRWNNLKCVGWTSLHVGKDPSPGFADKASEVIARHMGMIDGLDRAAAPPAASAVPSNLTLRGTFTGSKGDTRATLRFEGGGEVHLSVKHPSIAKTALLVLQPIPTSDGKVFGLRQDSYTPATGRTGSEIIGEVRVEQPGQLTLSIWPTAMQFDYVPFNGMTLTQTDSLSASGNQRDGAAPIDPRRYTAVRTFVYHATSRADGCAGDAGPTGCVRCGYPGAVSEVTWAWLRATPQGDVYRFTRVFPYDTPEAQTSVAEVTYAGGTLVVWEDAVHRIGLESPRLQFRLVAEDDDTAPADELADPDDQTGEKKLRVLREVLLDETAVVHTHVAKTDAGTELRVKFTKPGWKRFAEVLGRTNGKKLAVLVDGKVCLVPAVRATAIHGNEEIGWTIDSSAVAEVITRALTSAEQTTADAPAVEAPSADVDSLEKAAVEKVARKLLAAMHDKDDAALKATACDLIPGWGDGLPVFAKELRRTLEEMRGSTEDFNRIDDVYVEGDYAAVKAAGNEKYPMCLILFFSHTLDGWRNHSLRNAPLNASLKDLLATNREKGVHEPLKKRALALVAMLAGGKFAEARSEFDDAMRAAMPEAKLMEVWKQLADAGGTFLGAESATRVEDVPDCICVFVPCRWERNRVDLKVVFNLAGQVSGLWITPPVETGSFNGQPLEQWLEGKDVVEVWFSGPHVESQQLKELLGGKGINTDSDETFRFTPGEGGGVGAFVEVDMSVNATNTQRLLALQSELALRGYLLNPERSRVWSYTRSADTDKRVAAMLPDIWRSLEAEIARSQVLKSPKVGLMQPLRGRPTCLGGLSYEDLDGSVRGQIEIHRIDPRKMWETQELADQRTLLPHLGLIVSAYCRPRQAEEYPGHRVIRAAIRRALEPLERMDGGAEVFEK